MRKLLLMLATVLLFTGQLLAQTRTVTGKVTDDSGDAIPGATIQIKGTTTGTVTDGTGNFSINISPDAKFLVISLIGMTSKEIAIGSSNTYAITLAPSSSAIDEVVIVGYGSGKRAGTVVGSVTQVAGARVQDRPAANAFDALQGKVAGLQVFTSSGEPSQTSSIRIHGVGSLGASSTPLIILDGMPIDPATILTLNPEDFETVAILKDASATSIYGARAANGVIQISTKKGKIGEPVVALKTQYGVSNLMSVDYFENFMNSKELTDFWVATNQRTRGYVDTLLKNFPNDTKWYNEYYKKDVPTYQADLSVSGGAGKTAYYISGNYFHQDGLAYRSAYDRYTLRSNVNSTINDWLKLGVNLSGGYDKRQTNPYGTNSTNRGLALLAPPFYSPRDANGVTYPDLIPGWGRYNPEYLADKIRSAGNNIQLNLSGYVEITPIKNLMIRSQAGLEFSELRTSAAQLPSYLASLNNGSASETFVRKVTRTVTNTAEYKFSIADVHHLTAMAGQEYIDYNYGDFSASSTGQTDDRLIQVSNGPANRNVGSSRTEYAYLSYFGRLEYGFDDKYFVDLSLRQDQSSRFGKNNRTANFWSVGGMWKASRENFLKDVTWLKDLTVRGSYGTSGNSALDNNYLSLALVGTNTYENATGWGISSAGNPNLSWESQSLTTFGTSFNLFNRMNLAVEWYNKKTENMLVSVPYPYTSGFAEVMDNVGSLKNTGWDVTFDIDVYRTKKAYVTPRFNFNYNKNEVTELFQGKQYWIIPNTGVSWAVGQPVSFVYPVFAQVNKDTGLPEWYLPDPANITSSRRDPKAVTSTFTPDLQQSTGIKRQPPFNGGFGLDAGYDGFYLNVDFSFSSGKYLINNDRYFFENPNQFAGFNQSKVILDYWKNPGDIARFPRYGVQFSQFDSRLIEDASFLRMKNITIGYNFKSQLLRKTKFFKAANLYVTGRNLLTYTKYTGPDPEVDSNLALGTNPNTKQVAAGLNLQF